MKLDFLISCLKIVHGRETLSNNEQVLIFHKYIYIRYIYNSYTILTAYMHVTFKSVPVTCICNIPIYVMSQFTTPGGPYMYNITLPPLTVYITLHYHP